MTIRILIDKDNVVYDIDAPWLDLHNNEHPDHPVVSDDFKQWNRATCVSCGDHIYTYLSNPVVYNSGAIIPDSIDITQEWSNKGYELAFVSSVAHPVAATEGFTWLSQHFPHIPHIYMVKGHKQWISGDFLIDDGLHNHDGWEGISILFDQPWNQESTLLRAYNWQHVNKIVNMGIELLMHYPHDVVQRMLEDLQSRGIL